jgi:hypothetical protein
MTEAVKALSAQFDFEIEFLFFLYIKGRQAVKMTRLSRQN